MAAAALVMLAGWPPPAEAQYFGRNKVQYRTFTFQILPTEHFDIYYYAEETEAAHIVARMAERWAARLSRFFAHELRGRQPLILYASPAHFRQTNAVEGVIGEGTGGVTEALKRRIVLPMSGSLADTDHVLGHELVHAFQFDITGTDPRETQGALPEILQFPLWFAEGMAEYLSLGPVDAQTAMWLRDAALADKLPHVRDLNHFRFFPYRWGHAFWAYVGAKYGDRAVASLVRSAANPRSDFTGLALQLGTDPDTLTAEWHAAIRASLAAVEIDRPQIQSAPRRVLSDATGAGRINIGPRLSPDGRHIAFFSERDRFSVELFLADAATGRIERKLMRSATDPHFDSLQFLHSAGAWSPDGRTLAITAIRGGQPVVVLVDPKSGRATRELALPDLDDAMNPGWDPTGRTIVLSGNRGGLTDLYLLTVASGGLERLTSDPFADLEPTFTPDGRSVIFVSERYSMDLATLEPGPLRLAAIDLPSREVRPITAFLRGKHVSPQVSADGRLVTFIAEPDGVSNVYRMPIDGGPVERLSSFATGVAGIAASSPALSLAASGRMAFSVFERDGYAVYVLDEANIVSTVAPEASLRGAVIPPRDLAGLRSRAQRAGLGQPPPSVASIIELAGADGGGDVQRLLSDYVRGLPAPIEAPKSEPYRRKLSLDFIGQPYVAAGVGTFGGTVSGGLSAVFSDMLGDRVLGVGAQIAGDFDDAGAEAIYMDRRRRWNWGISAGQLPNYQGVWNRLDDPGSGQVLVTQSVVRETSLGATGMLAVPFTSTTRFEGYGGARRVRFTRVESVRIYDGVTDALLYENERETSLGGAIRLNEAGGALVHDSSFFGATSPILGRRYRIGASAARGSLNFNAALFDWRQYVMPVRPVTIAVRAMHMGRYGHDAESEQLMSLYAGFPEYVHGYGFGSFTLSECRASAESCHAHERLTGSRIAVANVEVRAPLIGLFRGEIEYGRVPIELAAFFDAGVGWSSGMRPSVAGGSRDFVRSYGAAVRVNAFGLMIVELAASRPLDRISQRWRIQLGIRQGF